jgi:hypothetical protein
MNVGHMSQSTQLVPIAQDFGAHLIGRDIGLAIRRKHFADGPDEWPAGLDMSGVEQATESCIDEMLGPLARQYGVDAVKRLEIRGATQPVAETLDYVLAIAAAPPVCLNAQAVQSILKPARPRKPTRAVSRRRRR